ncbi:hypothetical protein ACFFRR_008394 [Megaselia abdita]
MPNTPPVPRRAARPPRIQINRHYPPGSVPTSAQPPFTSQTHMSGGMGTAATGPGGQPIWPAYANPFGRTGEFMSKGFDGFMDFTKTGMSFGERFTYGLYNKIYKWSRKWFTHIFLFLVIVLYTFGGALIFQSIEGSEPPKIEQPKKPLVLNHQIQKNMLEAFVSLAKDIEKYQFDMKDFQGMFLQNLRVHDEAVLSVLNENKTVAEVKEEVVEWTFWQAMFYCGTIYTTIGYGHLTPKTKLGRSVTIIYAIIGIPMFLILLADFGKTFTRGLKFLWAYVRRLYYHGTCRKVRKHQHYLDVMSGINTVYDAAIRRPSTYFFDTNTYDIESGSKQPTTPMSVETHESNNQSLDTPTTYPETFEIDDEFNLPISLASTILILYILLGTFVYPIWETKWSYFESFYFVFISMSTIGFGDLVPAHPMFMMCSIVYLAFGLALTSMFINVVQIKLSDTFKGASSKLGATMGLNMAEGSTLGTDQIESPTLEVPTVHSRHRLNDISEAPNEDAISPSSSSVPPIPGRYEFSVEPPVPPREGKKKRKFFKRK